MAIMVALVPRVLPIYSIVLDRIVCHVYGMNNVKIDKI